MATVLLGFPLTVHSICIIHDLLANCLLCREIGDWGFGERCIQHRRHCWRDDAQELGKDEKLQQLIGSKENDDIWRQISSRFALITISLTFFVCIPL